MEKEERTRQGRCAHLWIALAAAFAALGFIGCDGDEDLSEVEVTGEMLEAMLPAQVELGETYSGLSLIPDSDLGYSLGDNARALDARSVVYATDAAYESGKGTQSVMIFVALGRSTDEVKNYVRSGSDGFEDEEFQVSPLDVGDLGVTMVLPVDLPFTVFPEPGDAEPKAGWWTTAAFARGRIAATILIETVGPDDAAGEVLRLAELLDRKIVEVLNRDFSMTTEPVGSR